MSEVWWVSGEDDFCTAFVMAWAVVYDGWGVTGGNKQAKHNNFLFFMSYYAYARLSVHIPKCLGTTVWYLALTKYPFMVCWNSWR